MKINEKYYFTQGRKENKGKVYQNLLTSSDVRNNITLDEILRNLTDLFNRTKKTCPLTKKNLVLKQILTHFTTLSPMEIEDRLFVINDVITDNANPSTTTNEDNTTTTTSKRDDTVRKALLEEAISKMQNFFSEFAFEPSLRFLNTFAHTKTKTAKKEYIVNYFKLQDNPYAIEIGEKIKSPEFDNIISIIEDNISDELKVINSRFSVYYGSPGTGKTTKAMTESSKCIVCASDMLPTDLMQNFAFNDGKAEFQKSDLWIAMENGETITLDEMNMLPFESLRFLQGITDGKETFNYKGYNINIHKDFKIIATMNLNVNGQNIPLPEPLVDRANTIIEFKLQPSMLVSALM